MVHAVGGDDRFDLGEQCRRVIPGRGVDLDTRSPIEGGDHGGDEKAATGAAHEGRRSFGRGQRGLPLIGIVEHERHEAADHLEIVFRTHGAQRLRLVRQVAIGTELGRAEPELPHLTEHAIDGEFQPPSGHLAHTPTDRCASDTVQKAQSRSPTDAHEFERHCVRALQSLRSERGLSRGMMLSDPFGAAATGRNR
jgi:hypothetical protein